MPSQFVILTVAPAGPRLRPQFTFQLPISLIEATSELEIVLEKIFSLEIFM